MAPSWQAAGLRHGKGAGQKVTTYHVRQATGQADPVTGRWSRNGSVVGDGRPIGEAGDWKSATALTPPRRRTRRVRCLLLVPPVLQTELFIPINAYYLLFNFILAWGLATRPIYLYLSITHNTQHTTRNTQHTTRNTQHTTHRPTNNNDVCTTASAIGKSSGLAVEID
jgi:hypothetical protein